VDWEKIGSSHARPLSEMLEFFKKGKKYAPRIVSLITPSAASSTSAPGSSTPLPFIFCRYSIGELYTFVNIFAL
jgi:hypothetical protein